MSFFSELKRRNVFKVAAAYIIVGWLLLQVSDTLVPALHLPEWFHSGVAFLLIIGFPLAVIFAWAFEMTPDGLKREKEVDRSQSITRVTGQKLNNALIGMLVLALGYFVIDKFVLDPRRDAELVQNNQSEKLQEAGADVQGGEEFGNKSIAVLPFVNMSDDGANEYFSDGLSEELLNLLAKIPDLKVAARTSSFQFKGKTGDIESIATQLKVANVLEGSVRKSGNQVRITAQLIKADDGYHLWSETYDRTLENIFAVQDEIAAAVVDALKVHCWDLPLQSRGKPIPRLIPCFCRVAIGTTWPVRKTLPSRSMRTSALSKSIRIMLRPGPVFQCRLFTRRDRAGGNSARV